MVDEVDHAIPIALDIQKTERLLVVAKSVPTPRFEQLIQCSDPAWQGQKSIGKVCHLRLSLVHCFDAMQLGQFSMGDLKIHQCIWNDTVGAAATLENSVGDETHQSQLAAAVYKIDTAAHHCRSSCMRGLGEYRVGA